MSVQNVEANQAWAQFMQQEVTNDLKKFNKSANDFRATLQGLFLAINNDQIPSTANIYLYDCLAHTLLSTAVSVKRSIQWLQKVDVASSEKARKDFSSRIVQFFNDAASFQINYSLPKLANFWVGLSNTIAHAVLQGPSSENQTLYATIQYLLNLNIEFIKNTYSVVYQIQAINSFPPQDTSTKLKPLNEVILPQFLDEFATESDRVPVEAENITQETYNHITQWAENAVATRNKISAFEQTAPSTAYVLSRRYQRILTVFFDKMTAYCHGQITIRAKNEERMAKMATMLGISPQENIHLHAQIQALRLNSKVYVHSAYTLMNYVNSCRML